MSDHRAALTYSSYLGLDEVLGAQRPRTAEHDERLFIVIHQVYELWFKELLHEGAHLQGRLEDGDSPHTLKRMLTILKTVVAQIDVLETMTPRQFLAFRDRLEAASGFQSAQFRELEALLGRRDRRALDAYDPDSPDHARIAAAMARPSLFDSFVRYLGKHGYALHEMTSLGYPNPRGRMYPCCPVERREDEPEWLALLQLGAAPLAGPMRGAPFASTWQRLLDAAG